MLTKFFCGVTIVGFCSFCGYLLAKKYRQRKAFFVQLKVFNDRFLSEVAYYRRPLRAFIASYTYKGEFDKVLRQFVECLEKEGCLQTFSLENDLHFLQKEYLQSVENYFYMLGRGDSSSQKTYFSSMQDSLAAWSRSADETCKKYGDLFVKLGFLCGLLLLILII